MKKILVTGGAGYIGSHVVKILGDRGYNPLTYDNLSSGNRWAVLAGEFVQGDLADKEHLRKTIREFKPDAIAHFAASIVVSESVDNPLLYYRNNLVNSMNLIEAAAEYRINNFLFSSTAAVYGDPEKEVIDENQPLRPINPYGASKMMTEQILRDVAIARRGFNYVSLRYFNVAGAGADGGIGQSYSQPTHLITRALKAAKGELKNLEIYGGDYPTPDGTCIRDYVHVDDLAEAHVKAFEYLSLSGKSDVFNCGYGHGYSVKEVLDEVKNVTGVDFPVVHASRRPGDSPVLIAQNDKIIKTLKWRPRYDNLRYIIQTAWDWEMKIRLVS